MNEERLSDILATAEHAGKSSVGCYGLDKIAVELVAEVRRLQECIYPGLPKWVPTSEHQQQDFYEAAAEGWRSEAERCHGLYGFCERVVIASHMRQHAGLSKPDFADCREGFCGDWHAMEEGEKP